MNRSLLRVFFSVVLAALAMSASAQKKITPVDTDTEKPQQPTLHFYDKHGNPLDEPVLFLSDLDTVKSVRPGPVYPLLYSASVGVNFFDGVMMLAGQKHANFDVALSLSLHNWFEPVLEFGLGFADNRPDEGNFTYKNKPSFYGKLGLNYNFLYKSNPDYQVYLGLRFGYSSFRYDITDITVNSDYWGQSNTFSLLNQKASAAYGQVLAGIKVKIWKVISMGWSLRYGFMMKSPQALDSTPWFVPGYGTTALSATFSVICDIPINTKKKDLSNLIEEKVGPGVPPPAGAGVAVPTEDRGPIIEIDNQ